MFSRLVAIALSVLVFGGGCPAKEPEDRPDVEACEHLKDGPAVTVQATATAQNAPAIASDHKRYDVTLTSVTGGNGGYVSYAAAAAGDHVFYLGTQVPVSFENSSGGSVAIEQSATSSDECAEIKGRHVVELSVGTYRINFGATTATSVGVVVEASKQSHEH